jgi:hypothetical protein
MPKERQHQRLDYPPTAAFHDTSFIVVGSSAEANSSTGSNSLVGAISVTDLPPSYDAISSTVAAPSYAANSSTDSPPSYAAITSAVSAPSCTTIASTDSEASFIENPRNGPQSYSTVIYLNETIF